MPQRNDVVVAGIHARGQDGGFVRLAAAVGEEGFLQRAGRERGYFLGHLHHDLVDEECGGVLQALQLLDSALGDFLVAVADRDGQHTAEEIEVALAISVPQLLTPGVIDDDWLIRVVRRDSREDMLPVTFHQCCAAGVLLCHGSCS